MDKDGLVDMIDVRVSARGLQGFDVHSVKMLMTFDYQLNVRTDTRHSSALGIAAITSRGPRSVNALSISATLRHLLSRAQKRISLHMQSLAYLHHSAGVPGSALYADGDVRPTTPLPHLLRTTLSLHSEDNWHAPEMRESDTSG